MWRGVNEPTFDEFAWAVGLFEGEGCIDMHSAHRPGRVRRYVRVRLTTTDEDVARRFGRIFPMGKVRGPFAKAGGKKPQFVWEAVGHSANQFLGRVTPHLCERRAAKAREVLDEAGLLREGQEALVV